MNLILGHCNGPVTNTEVTPWPIEWDDFLSELKLPNVGEKDGSYFTCSVFANNHRNGENQQGQIAHAFVLDGDSRIDVETGEFHSGAPDPILVNEVLTDLDITHCIYSSHSNGAKGSRYRVVIPCIWSSRDELEAVLEWTIDQLHCAGVYLNPVSENSNPACAWYLPRVPDKSAHEQFRFYEHDGMQPFPKEDAFKWHAEHQPPTADKGSPDFIVDARAPIDEKTPIGRFNKEHGPEWISQLLVSHGYQFKNTSTLNQSPAYRYVAPGSESGTAGVVLFQTKRGVWRAYSHHGEHDLLGDKARDAFDLLSLFEHRDDAREALASIGVLQQYDRDELMEMIINTGADNIDQFMKINKAIAGSTKLRRVEVTSLHKEIKKKTGIGLMDLRDDVKRYKEEASEDSGLLDASASHFEIAKQFVEEHHENDKEWPVSDAGFYHRFNNGLWEPTKQSRVEVQISKRYPSDMGHCSTKSDYRALAQHSYDMTEQVGFFYDAPVGVAMGDGFLSLNDDGDMALVPLGADHRQKIRFDFAYASDIKTPMWDGFLKRCFAGNGEQEQINHLQELFGATLMRLMPRKQAVALVIGPGETGKSTVLKIIERLLPEEAKCSVNPVRWGEEYYLASLAGKYLNVVGELPDDQYLPAAEFKQVTGDDLLQGRHPAGRPFDFRNEASHFFNCNALPATRDRSKAFFRRWRILEFANVLKSGDRIDKYEEKLLTELQGIVSWSIDGAVRLLKTGGFTETKAHLRIKQEWRLYSDSVLSYLGDTDVVVVSAMEKGSVSGTELYTVYKNWCRDVGRKALGRYKFYDRMDSPEVASLGIEKKREHDKRVFTGLRIITTKLRLVGDGW